MFLELIHLLIVTNMVFIAQFLVPEVSYVSFVLDQVFITAQI